MTDELTNDLTVFRLL